MNVMKFLPVLLLCFVSIDLVYSFKCFECGYFELSDGSKHPIRDRWSGYEEVAFCDDFTANVSNTKEALLVSQITKDK